MADFSGPHLLKDAPCNSFFFVGVAASGEFGLAAAGEVSHDSRGDGGQGIGGRLRYSHYCKYPDPGASSRICSNEQCAR
jgi:hypothetical protein